MKRLFAGLVGIALMLSLTMSWALPTLQQVESTVQQGNYAQAETMMKEVVDAKPESARAHYIYAEILAHNARFASASAEAAQARKLDPSIGFTDPVKFTAFEDLLKRQRGSSASARTAPVTAAPTRAAVPSAESTAPVRAERSGGVPPIVWLVGLLVIGFVLWRGLARSRAAAAGAAGMGAAGYAPQGAGMPMNNGIAPGAAMGYPPGGVAPNQGGYYNNPGYPQGQPMQQARQGSGMLGTGMAVAGGVAGGMLLDRMLNSRHEGGGGQGYVDQGGGAVNPAAFDSPASDAAAGELENRQVDFGSGNDWDTGGGGGGDSFDVGGGGSSSDDGWG